jgi:predicted PP-loop superfamily ATPase
VPQSKKKSICDWVRRCGSCDELITSTENQNDKNTNATNVTVGTALAIERQDIYATWHL